MYLDEYTALWRSRLTNLAPAWDSWTDPEVPLRVILSHPARLGEAVSYKFNLVDLGFMCRQRDNYALGAGLVYDTRRSRSRV